MMSPRRCSKRAQRNAEDSTVGSEALFHLRETLERAGKPEEALRAYEQVVKRTGKFENDPWRRKRSARSSGFSGLGSKRH